VRGGWGSLGKVDMGERGVRSGKEGNSAWIKFLASREKKELGVGRDTNSKKMV